MHANSRDEHLRLMLNETSRAGAPAKLAQNIALAANACKQQTEQCILVVGVKLFQMFQMYRSRSFVRLYILSRIYTH
jgi:hypothetical protein